jgi:hypothetical protein
MTFAVVGMGRMGAAIAWAKRASLPGCEGAGFGIVDELKQLLAAAKAWFGAPVYTSRALHSF